MFTETAQRNGHTILEGSGTAFVAGGHRPEPTEEFNYDAADQKFMDEQREIGYRMARVDQVETLRKAMFIVRRDATPLLCLDAFALALREIEATEEQIGSKYNVTKQAVSKRVKAWRVYMDLPPLGQGRSEKACESMKEASEKSWKKRKTLGEMTLNNRVS